jgi:hypothetical protein
MYIYFAMFSGMIGTCLSVLIRIELASPGTQILANDGQLFNTIVTAHAFLMIFFMVMPGLMGGFLRRNISSFVNFLNNSVLDNTRWTGLIDILYLNEGMVKGSKIRRNSRTSNKAFQELSYMFKFNESEFLF